jgi:hypothetical protein
MMVSNRIYSGKDGHESRNAIVRRRELVNEDSALVILIVRPGVDSDR